MPFFVHACMTCLSKICPEKSVTLPNFFRRIILNEHDWYLPLFRLELSSNFVLLVIYVTENQSNMNSVSSVLYCILYPLSFLSITRPSKVGFLLNIFFPFLDFDSLLNTYTISPILYLAISFFFENCLIISWLVFTWSLKHLLLSEFTFVNQVCASSSKSPSWKSNKTRNIQNQTKCLYQQKHNQLLCQIKIYDCNNNINNNSINDKTFSSICLIRIWMCPLVKLIMIVGSTFPGTCVLTCCLLIKSKKDKVERWSQ